MKRRIGKLEALIAIQSAQVERLQRAVEESDSADLKLEDALSRAVARLETMLLNADKTGQSENPPAITIVYDYGEENPGAV